MAKDKAGKPHKDGAAKEKKREKKVSRDGVEKSSSSSSSKKDKKAKRALTPSSSEDESDGPEGAPLAEPVSTPPLPPHPFSLRPLLSHYPKHGRSAF